MRNSNFVKCGICGNIDSDNFKHYTVREMMFGMGESFEYVQCNACGCLQIRNIPNDIDKYYPKKQYYSFQNKMVSVGLLKCLKTYIRQKSYRNILFDKKNIFGSIGTIIKPPDLTNRFVILKGLPCDNILDVGCGSGQFLDELSAIGFKNLQGVDLFIDSDTITNNGVKIKKGTIHDFTNETFNLIMLHHSFEHMEDQTPVMRQIATLLRENGICVIRIPVIGYAWETYATDWVQIDAPRHFYLHTVKSMSILADNAGMDITKVLYDSGKFQFVASELYKRDIPLTKQTKGVQEAELGINKIKEYEKKAKELNEKRQGDQAVFFLRKKKN